ncbi:MAG: hypothetical protein ACK4YP_06050, partial [Myxococcota bacterium]
MLLPLTLVLVLGCQGGGAPSSTEEGASVVVSRNEGIVVSAPGYAARVEAAWKEAEKVTISQDGAALVTKVGAPVMADVPDKIAGLDPKTEIKDVRADAKIKELLLGTDEIAAAEAIRATGARVMIVHSSLRPSMDRSKNVASRLYNHDALERFQLARVEDGALVYLVVDKPLQFAPELATAATQWLRATLSGQKPAPFPAIKPERSNWTMVATLRGRGQ